MKTNIPFLSLILVSALFPINAYSEHKKIYTIGIIPQFEIRHLRKIWTPIFNIIEKNTGYKLKFIGSPTIPDFGKEIKAGRFDFAYLNPYQLLLSHKSQGYIPLVRDIGRKLQGIIVVRRDSSIKSVNDLDGKKIAFPSANALGASLLIRADLETNFNINFNPVYVKTHSSVYLNVLVKQTEAGGGVQKTLEQQKNIIQSTLRVIYQTPKIAPHPLAAHPRVPVEIREKIKNTLLQLGNTAMGKSLLAKIPIKQIGSATMSDYTPLNKFKLDRFYIK